MNLINLGKLLLKISELGSSGRLNKVWLGINLLVKRYILCPLVLVFYRRMRGLSLEINHVSKIGRRNNVLKHLQRKHRRSLYDSSSSSVSFFPITFNMKSFGTSFGTGQSSSSQASSSTLIGSIFSHQIPLNSTTNPSKVINKFGLFQFEEDATNTPWHVSSPLVVAP